MTVATCFDNWVRCGGITVWRVVNGGKRGIRNVTIGCAGILGFLLYILYGGGTHSNGIFLTTFSSSSFLVVLLPSEVQ